MRVPWPRRATTFAILLASAVARLEPTEPPQGRRAAAADARSKNGLLRRATSAGNTPCCPHNYYRAATASSCAPVPGVCAVNMYREQDTGQCVDLPAELLQCEWWSERRGLHGRGEATEQCTLPLEESTEFVEGLEADIARMNATVTKLRAIQTRMLDEISEQSDNARAYCDDCVRVGINLPLCNGGGGGGDAGPGPLLRQRGQLPRGLVTLSRAPPPPPTRTAWSTPTARIAQRARAARTRTPLRLSV